MHQRPSLVQIRKLRERYARLYSSSALLHVEVAERLLERLEYIRLQPQVILDLNAASGTMTEHLLNRYPGSQVYATDPSFSLLMQQKTHERLSLIAMDMENLALMPGSVDLVVCNLDLAFLADPQFCFQQLNRILRPGGLFIFTSLGPDTLKELRHAFAGLDQYSHVWEFIDMHHLGDALLTAGWQDPVMDMEMLTLCYEDLQDLFDDLRVCGAKNLLASRCPHLMSRSRWQQMEARYDQCRLEDQQWPASFEIIYGHAWKALTTQASQQNAEGEFIISVDSIRKKGE